MTAMARRSPALATVPAGEDNILRFDDAPEFSMTHVEEAPLEDMDQQVREAQQRLSRLRAEQEEVEQQRKILENLKQKQERFIAGRKEITEKLERCLRAITDDLEDSRRHLENLSATQQDFRDRLDELKLFLPERWQRNQLDQELDKAISALIEAETSFEKGVRRITSGRPAETSPLHLSNDEEEDESSQAYGHHASSRLAGVLQGGDDLVTWARRGFAFTLPLMGMILLALLLAKIMF